MDSIADFNLFLRVIDLGSISAAARSMDLSVAAASQRLKRLERALCVRLLHRTTRRLTLTPEGVALAEQGRPLIEDLEALTGALRRAAGEVSGTLRMTAPASFGRQYLSPLVPRFLARHPRLKLSLDLSDQMRDLTAEGLDLAIRIGSVAKSTLVTRRIASNHRLLCASPAYLRRRGRPKTAADLAQHDCLPLATSSGPHDTWHLRAPDGTETAVRVRGRLQSNLGEIVRDAAIAGLGIAMHSAWHVSKDIDAGRLEVVLPGHRLPESAIYAVMPQRRLVLPRVRAFVDFLAESLAVSMP
jgi:DNA-binding transcriptional LysR family regulator